MSIAHTERSRDHSNLIQCLITVALALLFVPLLSAQTNAGTGSQIPRIRATGRVVNSLTGEAISRALVMIEGRAQRVAFTDSEGNFVFDDLWSVPLVFHARKPGFLEDNQTVITPHAGESITLKLNPSALIVGQVATDDGEPIESASIELLGQRVVDGRKQWTRMGNASTDEDGRFRLPNLRPGKYLISVGPFSNQALGQEATGFPTTYYPNAPDRNSATPVQIGYGQQVEANFSLTAVPVYTVMGTVVGQLDHSLGVTIRDSSGQNVGLGAAFNRTTGQFRIMGVPRGTYTLQVDSYSPSEDSLTGRVTITVTASQSGIVIPLHPTIKIPVEVRREDVRVSAPPEQKVDQGIVITTGQFGRRQFTDPGVRIRAVPTGSDGQENAAWGEPDQQGRIFLRRMAPGSYRILATPVADYYVHSVQSGGVNLLSEPLVISESGTVQPIEVVLRNDTAKIKGTVRGVTSSGALIAIPSGNDTQSPAFGNYGEDGHCYFPPLAPGTYKVYAFDHGTEEIEYANPEALEEYDSKSAQVTLSPNQTGEVTLDVIKVTQ